MSTATVNYFYHASLKRRFCDALDQALLSERIQPDEHGWLQSLTHPQSTDDSDPVRVDRLMQGDDSLKHFELTAALMVSHELTDAHRVYLFTLAWGVEAFADRQTLLATLRARFDSGNPETVFHHEKIDSDPFSSQMLAIVDQQVGQVGQLADVLTCTPTLMDASTTSLTRSLREVLPGMPVDPTTHFLQLASSVGDESDEQVSVQTLAQAAFDDRCNVPLATGMERRFLDVQGLPANAADSALFSQALADAATTTVERYHELLHTFWHDGVGQARTPRDLAIVSFIDSWRREFYSCREDGSLPSGMLNGLLPLLQATSGDVAQTTLLCSRMTLKIGDAPACALAGTFVIELVTDGVGPILWFAPDHRLMGFADVTAFGAHVLTTQGREQLSLAMALEDQPMLLRDGEVKFDLETIDGPLFADRVDSILAVQARNLDYVMRQSCVPENLTAMVDDALDVRQLIDPRLTVFNAGRWRRDVRISFADTWLAPEGAEPVAEQSVVSSAAETLSTEGDIDANAIAHVSLSRSWAEYVDVFDARAQRLRELDTVLVDHAEQALLRYLCVLINGLVSAQDICMQWIELTAAGDAGDHNRTAQREGSKQLVSMDLVTFLLECVSGHRLYSLTLGAQVVLDLPDVRDNLQVELIEHMLETITNGFAEGYVNCFKRSRTEQRRHGDRLVMPLNERLSICERAMRIDLALGVRQGLIDSAAAQMARQLLNRPVLSLRLALGVPATQAFTLSICPEGGFGRGMASAILCDTLVLRQPQSPDSPVMLWCAEMGWQSFASLSELLALMQSGLCGANRERWLALLGARDSRLLRDWLAKSADPRVEIRLEAVDGHAIQAMQRHVLDRQQQDVTQLCLRAKSCHFEAGLFIRLANATEIDWQLTTILDGLSIRIDRSIFEALLPPWITLASASDLKLYYNILKRYSLASPEGRNFMFGIPTLKAYTRERLMLRLKQDFPDQTLDPDQVLVTSRRYVSAFPAAGELPSAMAAATVTHRESLLDYAINRFVQDQDAALSVEVFQQPDVSALLNPDYVRRLVSDLDVGGSYIATLRRAFSPDSSLFAERRSLFAEQLPPAMLAQALPDKVVGRLSQPAYDFIARVLDMPDGMAREPLGGVRVIISPLQLVPTAGMRPDVVAGVYLICAQNPSDGPVVVYATYHPGFTFREFTSLETLMEAIRTEESLQHLLLDRIDPLVHRRYAYGGFVEPHLPFSVEGFNDLPIRAPGPVTLQLNEIKSNALHSIFVDALETLLGRAVSTAVTNDQARWAGRSFLATLALSQALTLLPSKVATLVSLWQSHTLFRASVDSASGKRWGQALSEFTAALGVMATMRAHAVEEPAPTDDSNGEPAQAVEDEDNWPLVFSWRDNTLNAEQRLRLQGLEAKNVSLSDMRHDELLNLYWNKVDDTHYAVVAGKVYQVYSLAEEGRWAIIGSDGTPGPLLMLSERQRWQLDLRMGLKGGGGMASRIKSSTALATAEGEIVIRASGMPEIRRYYRDNARRIGQAHLQAKRYLENCLDNLNVGQRNASLDPRVVRVIGDFFGVETPSPELLSSTERALTTMLDAVMDPTLSPFSSPRFVLGTSRSGRERVAAFVLPADPQRRVFLTELFFRAPPFHLTPEAVAEGFEATVHAQAATLLHELSHLALNTKDIAYLEPGAPYPDMLRGNTTANLRTRSDLERLQEYRLSHRSRKGDLFTQYEDGKWRDVAREDGLGFSTILRITQAKTLEEARTTFLSDPVKRSQVLLANADSLTLLIVQLGRYNHVVATP